MKNNGPAWTHSLWKATAESLADLDGLPGDIDTDLLIIGAGYTGLSCALHSIDSIDDIVVIDQAQPGWGCSGRNGGQINPQWKPALGRLRRLFPGDGFDGFVSVVDQSAALVFELIDSYRIDCHALRGGSLIAAKGAGNLRYLSDWSRFWKDYGADVELLDADATQALIGSDAYDACLLDRRGGSLQPLSYARGLARACLQRGVTIFGDTRALRVAATKSGWAVTTERGRVNCKRIVIGTNGYTDGLWPGLARSLIPVASMIAATRPLPAELAEAILPGRQCVAEFAGVPAYYRIDESNRMVFGWRGTLYGGIGSLDTTHLRSKAKRLFAQLDGIDWEYRWAGYVGITSHQRPMLLELGANAYAGLGYNGRGITMATMMGKQLASLLAGRPTQIAVEKPQPVPLHPLFPLGVSARIVYGHLVDSLRRPGTAGRVPP